MKRIFFLFFTIVIILHIVPFVSSAYAETQTNAHNTTVSIEQNASSSTSHAPHVDGTTMNLFWVIPFAGILLSLAVFPLLAPHFWHQHYGKISLFWGASFFIAFTMGYDLSTAIFYVLEACFKDYFPFIAVIFALFTVAGGIRLKGELVGTPKLNTIILLIGTVLASWMGTTGAAMLLIRPLIRANDWRTHKTHVVVFFIFLVANIGGSLTPLGDPPLFLGFLKGVDFFWTTKHMFLPMVTAVTILLTFFYIIDTYYYNKEEHKPEKSPDGVKISIEGKANLILIPLFPAAVLTSSLDLGTAFRLHHVPVKTASLLQISFLLAIAVTSLIITKKETRKANGFNWAPMLDVATLFATIFITMAPPIIMLKAGAQGPLGAVIRGVIDSNNNFIDTNFFWATGILSSFLDNAPTYAVFFETAVGGGKVATLMGEHARTLLAISAGAVFMGANTYIGNAPNFMVKSIAEEAGVPMPSFFGYIFKYTIPILIPTFIIITFIFFK
ncbi:MAG: sodium:proton antiporter [bacterium]|nr:sodium:proton antiporter [bacterium]